jgi:hypothetical protein
MASSVGSAVTSDTALKQKVLSTPEVLAQSVANMAPSAAMALLPLFVFYSAGNALWLSFALGLVVLLIVGYCAAEFASRINSAGSFYVWVTRGLGPCAGHAAGWGQQGRPGRPARLPQPPGPGQPAVIPLTTAPPASHPCTALPPPDPGGTIAARTRVHALAPARGR